MNHNITFMNTSERMILNVIPKFIVCYLVCVIFHNFYVNGHVSQEMIENGRAQYQLLQERGNLPQYGNCWKQAVTHVHEGCRVLSEESQSEMALHLTNCFLEMSGHDTYKCELDKKSNLRGICISTMTDRAFNVYIEFYTHTQNICWFLQGHIWHESIAENTVKLGKQLENSASNQETILSNQKESLKLQEKLLKYGSELEKIMESFYLSSQKHHEILGVLSSSLSNLQAWLIGEFSWFDTLIYYVTAAILIVSFTSTQRTAGARLLNLFILSVNVFIERLIIFLVLKNASYLDIKTVHSTCYVYIWFSRYVCVIISLIALIWKAYFYKDYNVQNNILLQNVYEKLLNVSENLDKLCKSGYSQMENVSFVKETSPLTKVNGVSNASDYFHCLKMQIDKGDHYINGGHSSSVQSNHSPSINCIEQNLDRDNTPKSSGPNNHMQHSTKKKNSTLRQIEGNERYNLRSKQGTPDCML